MITLFNILVNQKWGISVKEKQTSQPGNVRESYSHQNTPIHVPKKKKKNSLYSNEGTIDYNRQCHPLHLGNKQYKQFSQKKKGKRGKKKRECEREGEGEGKGEERERKREREEERLRKRGRESEKKKEKEKKEEKEKEEEKMEKAILKVHQSLQTHSLA